MAYNIKIIEYENGQIEVLHYAQGVRTRIDGETAYIDDVLSANDTLYKDNAEYVYNPFTEKMQRYVPESEAFYEMCKKNYSLMSSYNRTRSALYSYARQCNWEYFVTFTFSKTKIDRYDFTACMSKVRVWFNNTRQRKAIDLKYLIVPEQHKDGAWHVHGLIASVGNIEFSDSGKRYKGQIIYNLTGWKNGFSTATKIVDTYKASAYIVKYITKELCSITKGKQRYYVSQNIPKPVVSTALIDTPEVDNFIQTVADSLGADFEREKTAHGYLDVSYKYFRKHEEKETKRDGEQ